VIRGKRDDFLGAPRYSCRWYRCVHPNRISRDWIGHQNPESRNPPVINNSDSASTNTLNQTGGTNSLAFDRATGDQLVGKLPRVKPIDVVAVGSPADWEVVGQYAEYLKTKGFKVTLLKVGMVSPPPDQKIKVGGASDPRVGVIIAPSAFKLLRSRAVRPVFHSPSMVA
jgi:hypothetical protein